MTSMKPVLFILACLIGASFQQACSSSSDCTTTGSTCVTVSNAAGETCDYTVTDGVGGTPATIPYQECMTAAQLTAVQGDTNCVAASTSTTGCDDDTDCTTNGDCCIAQTCTDDTDTSIQSYICAAANDQDTATTATNGCSYGSCNTDNYVPTNFPCTTSADCQTSYSFTGYCCATLTCSGTVDTTFYCVPPTSGLDETGVFGGSDSSCTALCNTPGEAVCTAVPFDADSGTTSECAAYDNSDDDTTYCCAVQGQSNGDYTSGATGVCMNMVDLEEPVENTDDTYTVCSAKALLSSITLFAVLNLF